jgi:hypothetical protein
MSLIPLIKSIEKYPLEVEESKMLLKSLRWEKDMIVVTAFDEKVWLKDLYDGEKLLGITECCYSDDPCEYHLELSKRKTYERPI